MGIFHTINIESIINELLRYVNIIIIHVDLQRVIIINIKKKIDLECNAMFGVLICIHKYNYTPTIHI